MIEFLQLFEHRQDKGYWLKPDGQIIGPFTRHEHVEQLKDALPWDIKYELLDDIEHDWQEDDALLDWAEDNRWIWMCDDVALDYVSIIGSIPNARQRDRLKQLATELNREVRWSPHNDARGSIPIEDVRR